jgi:protein tyrosine/serine phosphatase
MQVKIYWIGEVAAGRLGLMPRPRGGDWLEDEIISLKRSAVDAVVSLLERAEIEELDITEEESFCRANGIAFYSFPIPDRNVPSSEAKTLNFATSLANLLKEGKSIVIHCRQGVGRASLIGATVMLLCGVPANEIFQKIEIGRGCAVPDTAEQRDWVLRLADKI